MKNIIKNIAFSFLFLGAINVSSEPSQWDLEHEFGYAQIAAEYIPSLGWTAPQPQPEAEDKVNFDATVVLSDYEKYTTVFDLLEKSARRAEVSDVSISPVATLMNNLNVLGYKSQSAGQRKLSLLNKIAGGGRVITVPGEAVMGSILAHPLSDIHELQTRQAALKALIQNPGHLPSFEAALQRFKQQETEFFGCYKAPSKTEAAHINKLFFQTSFLKKLNSNETVLGLTSSLSDAIVAAPLAYLSLIGASSGYLMQRVIMKNSSNNPQKVYEALGNHPQSFASYLKQSVVKQLNAFNPLFYSKEYNDSYSRLVENFKRDYAEQTGLRVVPADVLATACKAIKNVAIIGVAGLALGALYNAYMTGKILKEKIDTHKIDAYIQRKLMGCATMVRTFDALMEHVKADPALHHILTTWKQGCAATSKEFEQLLGMLRSATFEGQPSYFSKIGRVRAAYTLMMSAKDEFGDMVRFIGLCDAYAGIAKLYLQHQSLPNPYTFVDFVDQEKPYVNVEGFWNPMLDAQTAVSNDVELGSLDTAHGARGIVVTGSNSGGKSTIAITGLTSVMLLAHTLTIVPAQHMTVTPFSYLATSLKIQDNLLAGKSHFVAETEHAARLVASVKALRSEQKAFLAIDELFEGTTSAVGEASLHDLGLTLLKYYNLLFVIATQYQGKPTLLEEETDGACKNMKVDIIKQEKDGVVTLIRPYKLEPGVSNVAVGVELLQQAYSA